MFKGTRWLLLKNPDKFEDAREESTRLKQALELNAPLAAAYYLKEDLRRLWSQSDKAAAARFLDGWIERARATGIRQLRQMANTLSLHRTGLLAYYDVPITSGPLEGTNTKIQLLKRKAYGYRDRAFFKLRIYALHDSSIRSARTLRVLPQTAFGGSSAVSRTRVPGAPKARVDFSLRSARTLQGSAAAPFGAPARVRPLRSGRGLPPPPLSPQRQGPHEPKSMRG